MKRFVYCPSYPSLKLVFFFEREGLNVVIITPNIGIQKLCGKIGIDCIKIDGKYCSRTTDGFMQWAVHSLGVRRNARMTAKLIAEELGCSQLYFTTKCCDIYGLTVVSNLCGIVGQQVVYWPESKYSYSVDRCWMNKFSYMLSGIYYRLFYGIRVKCRGYDLFVDSKNLRLAPVFDSTLPFDFVRRIPYVERFGVEKKICVILGGYSLGQDVRDFGSDEIYSLYDYLAHLPLDFIYKPHPGEYKLDEWVLDRFDLFSMPDFPIESFVDDLQLVVSIGSTALPSLANHGVMSICLLDLLDHSMSEGLADIQNLKAQIVSESEGRVLFPKSKSELNSIICTFMGISEKSEMQ